MPADRKQNGPADRIRRSRRSGSASVVAARDLHLEVRPGEFLSLLGPSGCGKTTSLRMIAGFEQPSEGEVRIDGENMNGVPAYRRPVNMVFQHYALFPHLDVAANVAYGLRQRAPRPGRAPRSPGRWRRALEMVRLTGFEAPAQLGAVRRPAAARGAGARAHQPSRRCCCSTSRSPRSTASCAARCRSSCRTCSASSASPSCWSPTTRKRRCR